MLSNCLTYLNTNMYSGSQKGCNTFFMRFETQPDSAFAYRVIVMNVNKSQSLQ